MFFILQSSGKLLLCDKTLKYMNQGYSDYPSGHGAEKLTGQIKMLKLCWFINHLRMHRRSKEKKKGQLIQNRVQAGWKGHCLISALFSPTHKSSQLMVWFWRRPAIETSWEMVKDREAWRSAVHVVRKSRTRLSDWTTITGSTLTCCIWEKQGNMPGPCCDLPVSLWNSRFYLNFLNKVHIGPEWDHDGCYQ